MALAFVFVQASSAMGIARAIFRRVCGASIICLQGGLSALLFVLGLAFGLSLLPLSFSILAQAHFSNSRCKHS